MTTLSLWKKVIRAANLDGGSCCGLKETAGLFKSLQSFFVLAGKVQTSDKNQW